MLVISFRELEKINTESLQLLRGVFSRKVFISAVLNSLFLNFLRVPCRSGVCTTPMHVTSSQLTASDVIPVAVVKSLLYPGAMAHGLVKNLTIPSWNNLVDIYNLTSVKEAPVALDLKRLEVRIYDLSYSCL